MVKSQFYNKEILMLFEGSHNIHLPQKISFLRNSPLGPILYRTNEEPLIVHKLFTITFPINKVSSAY
jgi:hypothetical protein